jgi:hypothetical protein
VTIVLRVQEAGGVESCARARKEINNEGIRAIANYCSKAVSHRIDGLWERK